MLLFRKWSRYDVYTCHCFGEEGKCCIKAPYIVKYYFEIVIRSLRFESFIFLRFVLLYNAESWYESDWLFRRDIFLE